MRSRALLALLAALAVGGAAGATLAVGQSDGVLNACYNSSSGVLRVITPSAPRECQPSETAVQLGSGPGPQGPPGPPGPSGSDEAAPQQVPARKLPPALTETLKPPKLKPEKLTEAFAVYDDDGTLFPGVNPKGTTKAVSQIKLPAGSWVVVAKANVWELGGDVTCLLRAGDDFDRMIAWESGMIVGTVVHRFKKPNRAWLQCVDGGASNLGMTDIKITAIEVDKITNKATGLPGL